MADDRPEHHVPDLPPGTIVPCPECGQHIEAWEFEQDLIDVVETVEAWPGGPLIPCPTSMFVRQKPVNPRWTWRPCGHVAKGGFEVRVTAGDGLPTVEIRPVADVPAGE